MSGPAASPASSKPQELDVRLDDIIQETHDVRTFRVGVPKSANFHFLPGQFVMLSFPNDKLSRAYSMASSPLDEGYLDLTMREEGVFTKRMFQLKGGETLKVKGPYGKFIFTEDMANEVVLISGGTGVTPFRGIARYVLQKHLPTRVTIIYSVRTPNDVIFGKEFQDMAQKHPQILFLPTVTRPQPGDNWPGRTGRISPELLKSSIPDLQKPLYYFCGPPDLIKASEDALKTFGVPETRLHKEAW